MSEREAFEKWAAKYFDIRNFTMHDDGDYLLERVADMYSAWRAARAQGDEGYPNCDTCGCGMNYMPWHYSSGEQRHIHACDDCWPKVNPANSDNKYARAQGAEPVAWVAPTATGTFFGETVDQVVAEAESFGAKLAGTIPLYIHPPAKVPEGWKIIRMPKFQKAIMTGPVIGVSGPKGETVTVVSDSDSKRERDLYALLDALLTTPPQEQ